MRTASPRGDRQRQSSNGTEVDSLQLPLLLPRPIRMVDLSLVRDQPTMLAAIKLCISLAGLDADKEVHIPLEIDAGHWTRICRGEAHFPVNKLSALFDLCGNEAPLLWLLENRGYDAGGLHKRETETEAKLRKANERIASLESERAISIRLWSDMLHGKGIEGTVRV